jgi:hypothetical protein
MRTQASWEEQQRLLDAARVLADYANLEPDGVEGFAAAHPDFVPAWWFAPLGGKGKGPWMRERDLVREAWGKFPADLILRLVTSHWFTFGTFNRREESAQQKEWPYQQAVMFLHVNSWRAKTCEWCGKRFIGEYSQARFCSFGVVADGNQTTCYWAHRKQYTKGNWIEHSDRINEERRRKYQLEKKRSRRANRKNLRQR